MAINVNRGVLDPFYRYKMPKILAKVEGKGNGIKTVIANMSGIAKALGRPPSYPTKYFGFELGAQTDIDLKNDRYIVNGEHDANKLQDILDFFIREFVLCPACDNPETALHVKKNLINSKCKACGHAFVIDSELRLSSFIVKNPPAIDPYPADFFMPKLNTYAEDRLRTAKTLGWAGMPATTCGNDEKWYAYLKGMALIRDDHGALRAQNADLKKEHARLQKKNTQLNELLNEFKRRLKAAVTANGTAGSGSAPSTSAPAAAAAEEKGSSKKKGKKGAEKKKEPAAAAAAPAKQEKKDESALELAELQIAEIQKGSASSSSAADAQIATLTKRVAELEQSLADAEKRASEIVVPVAEPKKEAEVEEVEERRLVRAERRLVLASVSRVLGAGVPALDDKADDKAYAQWLKTVEATLKKQQEEAKKAAKAAPAPAPAAADDDEEKEQLRAQNEALTEALVTLEHELTTIEQLKTESDEKYKRRIAELEKAKK